MIHEYRTTVEIPVVIKYRHQPAEKPMQYSNGNHYPGCREDVELVGIEVEKSAFEATEREIFESLFDEILQQHQED